jgi:hypothetical protein
MTDRRTRTERRKDERLTNERAGRLMSRKAANKIVSRIHYLLRTMLNAEARSCLSLAMAVNNMNPKATLPNWSHQAPPY